MKKLSFWFKLAVTGSILYWLGSQVEWSLLGDSFRELRWGGYFLALIALLIGCVLAGVRWYYLLQVQSIHLPLRKALNLTFIGLFFNVFLLGTTGGDLTKLYYLNRYVPNRKTAGIVSLLMDRGIGLLVLIGLALPFLPFQASVLWQNPDTRIYAQVLIVLFAGGLIGLVGLFLFPAKRLPDRWRTYLENHPQLHVVVKLFSSIREHGREARTTGIAVGLSVISQGCNILGAWLLAGALGLDATFGQCVVVIAIVFTIVSLPISIGGHGVRELAFVKVFYVLGVISMVAGDIPGKPGKEAAIAFSLLYFSLQLVWSLVGGAVYLFSKHAKSEDSSTQDLPSSSEAEN